MRKQKNMFQMEKQDKIPGRGGTQKNLNKMEISNLPDIKFKIMVTKIFTNLRRRMDENKEIENTSKYQTEVKELKNITLN